MNKQHICACVLYTPQVLLSLKIALPSAQPLIENCETCRAKIIVTPATFELKKSTAFFCVHCANNWLKTQTQGNYDVVITSAQLKELASFISERNAKKN